MASLASRLFLVTVILGARYSDGFTLTDNGSDPPASTSCLQLGCDKPGTFTQDGFNLPLTPNRTVVWSYKSPILTSMNAQNTNYGCIGSPRMIVCPYLDKNNGNSIHIVLDPETGKPFDTSGYETLVNVNMPVLTKDDLILASNSTHASLVDPINNRSSIISLPTENMQGMHSPVHMSELGLFLVFGNLSETHSIYKIGKSFGTGQPELDLLATFSIARKNNSCPWLPVTEPAVNGNRVYFYVIHKDGSTGIVAVNFTTQAPYYQKSWELVNYDSTYTTKYKGPEANCSTTPGTNPEYGGFPPVDVNVQMITTPDNFLIVTTPIALLTIKDWGDAWMQSDTSLFGGHYLTLDTSPTSAGKAPIVWISGWPKYDPFRILVAGYNYSMNYDHGKTTIWYMVLSQKLGVRKLKITSRLTTFSDPSDDSKKILVFGINVNDFVKDSPFYTKYCPECSLGINSMLMAVRTAPSSTQDPEILWIIRVSEQGSMEVRGQVIGVSDKLIMFVSDKHTAEIIAMK